MARPKKVSLIDPAVMKRSVLEWEGLTDHLYSDRFHIHRISQKLGMNTMGRLLATIGDFAKYNPLEDPERRIRRGRWRSTGIVKDHDQLRAICRTMLFLTPTKETLSLCERLLGAIGSDIEMGRIAFLNHNGAYHELIGIDVKSLLVRLNNYAAISAFARYGIVTSRFLEPILNQFTQRMNKDFFDTTWEDVFDAVPLAIWISNPDLSIAPKLKISGTNNDVSYPNWMALLASLNFQGNYVEDRNLTLSYRDAKVSHKTSSLEENLKWAEEYNLGREGIDPEQKLLRSLLILDQSSSLRGFEKNIANKHTKPEVNSSQLGDLYEDSISNFFRERQGLLPVDYLIERDRLLIPRSRKGVMIEVSLTPNAQRAIPYREIRSSELDSLAIKLSDKSPPLFPCNLLDLAERATRARGNYNFHLGEFV